MGGKFFGKEKRKNPPSLPDTSAAFNVVYMAAWMPTKGGSSHLLRWLHVFGQCI